VTDGGWERRLFASIDPDRPGADVAGMIAACRADAVPVGNEGLWRVSRTDFTRLGLVAQFRMAPSMGGFPTLTMLQHRRAKPLAPGDPSWCPRNLVENEWHCVMEDSPGELSRHLPILLVARGRVLVTGLGLGCVVRGLLSKPGVDHVTVIEVDAGVIRLCWTPDLRDNPRVSLLEGDALTLDHPSEARWDYAWHDIWDRGECEAPLHVALIERYASLVSRRQGAWMIGVHCHRSIDRQLLGGKRRPRRYARALLDQAESRGEGRA
jgi:hypothetical protein